MFTRRGTFTEGHTYHPYSSHSTGLTLSYFDVKLRQKEEEQKFKQIPLVLTG